MMQEAARVWLHFPSNSRATGFGTVAELYLLHVLLPLGHRDEALELIAGEVGNSAFTEDQRQMALDVVEESERQNREASVNSRMGPNSDTAACTVLTQGVRNHFRVYNVCFIKSCDKFSRPSDCVCVLQEL